jgi:putative hydroxymethylpyrimidine transport system substrate-binding protein
VKKIVGTFILLCSLISTCYASQLQKMTVLLDWFANPNHGPLFIAKEHGFFKEQGLDVDLIGPADPSDPPKLVAAGKADIAITYQPEFIKQVDQGLPLILIGTLIDKPLNCLVVLKDSNMQSIRDLKGKSIGYSGGMNNITLKVMLEKNGLSLHDVTAINVHYDLTQALLSKRIDAVIGMMPNFELIQMELAGHPGRAFYPTEQGMPTYSELIFVARNDHKRDEQYSRFLIAVKKGIDYVQKHPEETWQEFAKAHPELNDELNRRAWFVTLNEFTKNPAKLDKKNWQQFAKFLLKNKVIQKIQPMDVYALN